MLEPPTAGFVAIAAFGIAGAAFYRAFRAFRYARLIEDTPTSSIRAAAQGYVELCGQAEMLPGDPVVSPLTGMRCAWYSFRVDRRGFGSVGFQRRPPWVGVQAGRSEAIFALRDASGHCVVDPEGATVITGGRDTWYGNSDRPAVGPKAGSRGVLGVLFHRYRYVEERISSGDLLYAIGRYRTVGGGDTQVELTQEVGVLLRLWKRDRPRLLHRFDRDRNGEIDSQEWEQARKVAREHVLRERTERVAEPGVNLLRDPRDRRYPFLLSNLSGQRLARRLRAQAVAWLAGFFLLGSAGAWLLGGALA